MISTTAHSLTQELDEFVKLSSKRVLRLQSEAKDFHMRNSGALASNSARIDKQMQLLQDTVNTIQAKDALEAQALGITHRIMQETHETLMTDFIAWGEDLKNTCDTISYEIQSTGVEAFTTVEATLQAMVSLVENVTRETIHHIDVNRDLIHQAQALASSTSTTEITRLRQQNEVLLKLLESEAKKACVAKDELMQRVSSVISDFTSQRDRSLQEAFEIFQTGNNEGGEAMETFINTHGEIMGRIETDGLVVVETLQRRNGEGKRTRDGAFKVIFCLGSFLLVPLLIFLLDFIPRKNQIWQRN